MAAGSVSVWRFVGAAAVAMTLSAACTADPPTATTWIRRASMRMARSEMPAAVVDGAIFVAGGLVATAQGVGVAASVERYDVDADTWSWVADLPAPRHHTMSAAVDGRVYVLGGFGERFDPWATAWLLDVQKNEWLAVADLPVAVGAGAAVEIAGLIYVVGGVPTGTSLFAYDPAANTWESLPPMTQAREHTAAVTVEGDLWVLGGRWEGEMLGSVEIFDPESGRWSKGPAMREARSGFGATVLAGSIFVAGGEVFDQSNGFEATALDSVERLDGGSWTAAEPLPRRLHGIPLAAVGDTIYLLSGSTRPAGVDNTGEVWALRLEESRS